MVERQLWPQAAAGDTTPLWCGSDALLHVVCPCLCTTRSLLGRGNVLSLQLLHSSYDLIERALHCCNAVRGLHRPTALGHRSWRVPRLTPWNHPTNSTSPARTRNFAHHCKWLILDQIYWKKINKNALSTTIIGSHCMSPTRCTRNSAIADKPRDAFRIQSMTSHMVPFHMLGMVSYQCAIVTLSQRRTVFQIFDFKKCYDLEIRVRGHSRSLNVVPIGRMCMVSYYCPIVTLSAWHTVFEIFDFKNALTLMRGLGSVKVIENVTIR